MNLPLRCRVGQHDTAFGIGYQKVAIPDIEIVNDAGGYRHAKKLERHGGHYRTIDRTMFNPPPIRL